MPRDGSLGIFICMHAPSQEMAEKKDVEMVDASPVGLRRPPPIVQPPTRVVERMPLPPDHGVRTGGEANCSGGRLAHNQLAAHGNGIARAPKKAADAGEDGIRPA